ncbi:TadE/TadG family type IV pilus assembly protein [Brevundimonas sp. R86498]|uniref:TadE/TadG family type IV pilus assembly protein n=1 Tax=Brevundimonas sp. R86498 TaxID=3093845 RepID=UPI0037C66656
MTRPPFWQRWRKAADGAVAVEFALWSVFALVPLLMSIDFGFYLAQTGRIASAAEQAALVTYNRREAGPVDTATLATFLNASARVPGGAVRTTITCNGTTNACSAVPAARSCVCVSGLPAAYSAAASCGAPCPGGATSGYYVTLTAEHTFDPMISPHPFLEDRIIRQSVTVRLK